MSEYNDALAAARRESSVALAQVRIIEALRPLKPKRREQLVRFLMSAVENDCLELIRTSE